MKPIRQQQTGRRSTNKQRICIIEGMAPKTCTVTVTDANGSRHSVQVLAESLYEAAALGLKLPRDADWVHALGPMTRSSSCKCRHLQSCTKSQSSNSNAGSTERP